MCARLAADREAALPKAISWVLRRYAAVVPTLVAEFMADDSVRLPAVARREVSVFLATGRKRPATARESP
jgi:hypothetical protein